MQIVTSWMEQGIAEGEQIGEQHGRTEEARSLVLRQLSRRVGTLPATVEAQVQALALPQLEALGEALLDFVQLGDLSEWLQGQ
jgi:predicted transposase YdaD